jgi:CTP synthase
MAGRILLKVINDERAGKYQGEDVQIIPHLTGAIQNYIKAAGEGFDVHIVEIGGTVGDLESLSFIEAIREFGMRVGMEHCAYVHVVYMPYLGASKETKTKPAQNAVRELRAMGIAPNVLVARSEGLANPSVKSKLSLFCGVEEDAIALLPNAPSIYQVPLTLEDTGIADVICRKLDLDITTPDLKPWREMVDRSMKQYDRKVIVGVVDKYMDNQDTYMCVFEALRAASWWNDTNIEITWVDAEKLEEAEDVAEALKGLDGIVVPGGFGTRGVEGKIKAAQYALKSGMPYLGLCLGMQVAVIAAARNAGMLDATSAEMDPSAKNKVINTMSGQEGKENTGGTMRLGDYPCKVAPDSLVGKLYGVTDIVERHRHRYECSNDYRDQYESWGIRPVGLSPDERLVEMIEVQDHPFFVASQFHPEFKGRPNHAHPMFDGFVVSLLQKQTQ